LIPSFVPGREQREWRMMTRMKVQLPRDRMRASWPAWATIACRRAKTNSARLSGQQEAVLRLAKVPGLGAASGDV
jgi:hypothetical protein